MSVSRTSSLPVRSVGYECKQELFLRKSSCLFYIVQHAAFERARETLMNQKKKCMAWPDAVEEGA